MYRRTTPAIVALLAFSACDLTTPAGPADDDSLPPLATSVWYAHAGAGAAMPALLREVDLGGDVERDYVDSLRLEISDTGAWFKSAWYHRFRDDVVDHWAAHYEWGTWRITEDGYVFSNAAGEEAFVIALPPDGELALTLRYAVGVPARPFTLQPESAPATFHGRWRAATLSGNAVPAVLYQNLNEDVPGGGMISWSIVIDSAFVVLFANGRYQQQIYHSEYQGAAGSAPTQLFGRFYTGDFGTWTRTGTQMQFVSGWISGHTMLGSASATGAGGFALNHGLTQGDPPAPFVYQR